MVSSCTGWGPGESYELAVLYAGRFTGCPLMANNTI